MREHGESGLKDCRRTGAYRTLEQDSDEQSMKRKKRTCDESNSSSKRDVHCGTIRKMCDEQDSLYTQKFLVMPSDHQVSTDDSGKVLQVHCIACYVRVLGKKQSCLTGGAW